MGLVLEAGWIRPEVALRTDERGDCIRFSHWEVQLPRGFVAGHPVLAAVLSGRAPRSAIAAEPASAGVVGLIEAQGGFATLLPHRSCSRRELRLAFDRLRSLWMSAYYTHPLWERLRSGRASRAELVAWVLHNYQVSRIAGPVAARCAAAAHASVTRRRFLDDALDEFWHAEAFYFVRHPGLSLSDEQVACSVPLPATRAFELHTLQTAERNALGHILIAYHQESTVHFLDDCLGFYDEVERRYGLPGFFGSWQAHMCIDREEGHCDGVAQLLDGDEPVPPRERDDALRAAWLAHHHLMAALDDIVAEGRLGEAPDLRAPSSLTLPSAVPSSTPPWSRPEFERKALGIDFARCLHAGALAALAHASDHDELTATGVVLRALDEGPGVREGWQQPMQSPWMAALCDLLRERAEPRFLAHVLPLLQRQWALRTGDPSPGRMDARLQRLANSVQRPLPEPLRVDVTQALAFLERALDAPLMQPVAWQP